MALATIRRCRSLSASSSVSFQVSGSQPSWCMPRVMATRTSRYRPIIPTRSTSAQGTGRRGDQAISGKRGERPSKTSRFWRLPAYGGASQFDDSKHLAAVMSQDQIPTTRTVQATTPKAAAGREVCTSAPLPRENAGRGDDVVEARIDGGDDREPDGNVERPIKPVRQRRRASTRLVKMMQRQQAGSGRDALERHFELAHHLGRKVSAPSFNFTADRSHEHLATHNHNSHPRSDATVRPLGCEEDKSAADNDLIDERIENASQLGYLAKLPRPPAVDPIGRGGDDEDDHRCQVVLKRNKHEDDDRQQESERRKDVGDVDDDVGGRVDSHDRKPTEGSDAKRL